MRPAIEVYRCASYEDAKLYGSIEGEEAAAAVIEADRAEVRLAERFAGRLAEREAVAKWLLSDAARLDYEASGSEEHFSWWAADQVNAGEHHK